MQTSYCYVLSLTKEITMPTEPDNPPTTTFPGFDIPRQNWFKLPNNWTDITAEITSLAELKVVEYVLKHTWGYQEYGLRKRISNDEFMNGRRRKDGTRIDNGTGLSKPSVIAGLKSAIARGLLLEEVDDSDKARVKKYYSLRMIASPDDDPDIGDDDDGDTPPTPTNPEPKEGGVKDLNAGVKNLYPGVKDLYPRGKESLPRTEKDTLARHLQEETNNNNSGEADGANQADVVVALTVQGIAQKVAERLANRYSQPRIAEKIKFLEFLKETDPQKVKSPQGWLRRAIEEDYAAPDGYKSAADREAEAAEKQRRHEAMERDIAQQEERRQAERAKRQQAADDQLAQLKQQYGTTQHEVDVWCQIMDEFKTTQTSTTFQAYTANTILLKLSEGEALIGVTNPIALDWVENRMTKQIQRKLASYAGGHKVTPTFISLSQPRVGEGGHERRY